MRPRSRVVPLTCSVACLAVVAVLTPLLPASAGVTAPAAAASAATADVASNGSMGSAASGGTVATKVVSTAAIHGRTQRTVTVVWKGQPRAKQYSKSVLIPAIGAVTLTCRPNKIQISIRAGDRNNETQMWLAKYEDKNYGSAVAVKTVRVYRWANADDNGRGGTANPQHEGLNQRRGVNGVENYGKGYAYGIISQRQGRQRAAANAPLDPATTFNANWYWNGFDYPPRYRYCKVQATFLTRADLRIGINWHGNDAAQGGHDSQQVRVGSLGRLNLRCEPGRHGARNLSLVTNNRRSSWYAEVIEGEGRVENNTSVVRRRYDSERGRVGPMPLPRNGMIRIFFDNGRSKIPYLLSSYQITNNPRAGLNLCEVAMAQMPS